LIRENSSRSRDLGCNMATARSVSNLKKTSTSRRGSLSLFSNSKEDIKVVSALRQRFEDVEHDERALKELAYQMIETALLGGHVKAEVRDVIDEFEHGKVLSLVDPATKGLIKKWVQKGIKHFVENPDLANLLTTWGNAYVQEERVSGTKGDIKKRGSLIPFEGVAQEKKISLTNYIHAWNSNSKTRGLKCWLTLDKGKEENSWSDRKHLPKGKLSGLQFKTDQDWICQVRARYGTFWAPWRLTGPENPDAKTHNIELGQDDNGNQEGITSVSGIYRNPDKEGKDANMAGWIENLTLGTNWNKQHGPYGDELTPLMSTNRFVESPAVEGAILSHLSGSTRKGDVHLAFHWVVLATDETIYHDPTYDEMLYAKNEPVPTESNAGSVETRNPDNDQPAEYIYLDDV